MSELKIYKQSDILWGHWFTEYCRKDEADKVIAEKDKEIARQNTEIKNAVIDLKLRDKMNDELAIALKHQKYRRCLAMHDYCLCELEFAFRDPCIERSTEGCVRWRKWANLWLELAEKFKEAK